LLAKIESDKKECQMSETKIKGIIRIKNGYKEMKIEEPRYGDIKLNVILEDQQTSMIGEIQFIWLPFLIAKQRSVNHSFID